MQSKQAPSADSKPRARHRRRVASLLIFVGIIVYCILPDETLYLGPRGRGVMLDLRTGGIGVDIFWRWSPTPYQDHRAPVFGFLLAYQIRTGVPPWRNCLMIGLPWWFLAAMVIAPALDRKWIMDRFDRQNVSKSGLCPTCGYDLRATPNRCPECGATPPV